MPPRSSSAVALQDVPTYDVTARPMRLVPPPPASPQVAEPSPLLEAIRAYLEGRG